MRREWKPIMPPEKPRPPLRIHWLSYVILACLASLLGAGLGWLCAAVAAWWTHLTPP